MEEQMINENDTDYVIDLTGVTSREELHDRIEEALPLPGYYGRNLDALYDALQEISGTVIVEGILSEDAPAADPAGEEHSGVAVNMQGIATEDDLIGAAVGMQGETAEEQSSPACDTVMDDAMVWDPLREYLNDLRITLRDAELDNPDLTVFMM